MLELKTYTVDEMKKYLATDRIDSINSKLQTIGCEFETKGRSKDRIYTITKLPNQFKEFCIYELGVPPQTDFDKLKNFLYYYFFSDGFFTFPIQEMENILHRVGKPVARQTFTKWISLLENNNLIYRDDLDCVYYACCHTKEGEYYVKQITQEEYINAWRCYFRLLNTNDKGFAYANAAMKNIVGGKAVKCPTPKANALTYDRLKTLMQLVLNEKNSDTYYESL